MTPEEFRRRYSIQTAGNDFEKVLGNIEHFLSDADIRARDPRYKAIQENAIERIISALRSGAVDEAGSISLLGE